jgi:6-phosphogluconolactonase
MRKNNKIKASSFFTVLILIAFQFQSCKSTASTDSKSEHRFYIGTYKGKGSEGIYMATFNAATGQLSIPKLAARLNNPSFQTLSPDNTFLWSVSESENSVESYLIDKETGHLKFLAQSPSHGQSPCYLSYHQATSNLCIANYTSGTASRWKINEEGTFGNSYTQIQHEGTGPRTDRQEAPHAHCFLFDPNQKYGYSCDLGADKIYVYFLRPHELITVASIATPPGFGPRHVAFHPGKELMAVLGELDCTVALYAPDARGIYSILKQQISTLPDGFIEVNTAADIHFSPDGKFLYASNRGHNSIAIYKVSKELHLERVGWQTKDINWPRNFAIAPGGKYMLVANQKGNSIVVFSIDGSTGQLNPTDIQVTVSQPVCITFLNQ